MSEHSAEKDAGRAQNPYDHEDTCNCSAWSDSECACGGYVDRAKVRAWQQGYDAAAGDLEVAASIVASLRARLDAASDLADHLVGNEVGRLIQKALNGYVPSRVSERASE